MTTTDTTAGAPLAISVNDDSVSSASKTGSTKKHYVQHFPPQQGTPTNRTIVAANTITTVATATAVVDDRDKASFYKDLYHFHEVKGTPIPRVPRVNGHEIDLHKFYSLVCSRGGWAKINYRNEWEDLVPEFDLPSKCVNASVALKQIYMRFLDRYEKIHFLGEDNDRIADETDEDNRHKKWNNKHFNDVPMKYNYLQHNVSESMRATHKLSTDLYKSSEYERLMMSLMSPLPNEQDFAVNVCTLMANESRHTLKVERCPKLLDALMGHAGVYSHHSMRDLFFEYYSNVRKHSLQSFWNDCLHDKPDIMELTYEDYFEVDENITSNISGRPPVRLRNNDMETFEDGLNTRSNELNEFTSLDFLNLKRGLGTHDYIGQRVHQVSTICRNLSFFEENLPIIVKNRTFVRFLVMCSNIRWGNLHQMGLDTLGNIAAELDLCDPSNDNLTKCLLTTIAEGLESPDRGVIISCLEILYKLCQKGSNEDHLHKYLDKRVYRQICMYLSLNDIMLLLYTLECLFALSSMGEKACFAIVQINGVIDTLVSLVSVEAQSYGPDGCILMRVVETVPTPLASQQQGHHSHQHNYQQQSHATSQPVITQLQSSPSTIHVPERNVNEMRVEVKNEPLRIEKPIPTPVIPQHPIDVATNQEQPVVSQQQQHQLHQHPQPQPQSQPQHHHHHHQQPQQHQQQHHHHQQQQQQHHHHQSLSSLPSPPPKIVQSTIPISQSVQHTPIVVPVPKPQISRVDVKPEIKFNQSNFSNSEPIVVVSNTPATVRTQTTVSPTVTTVAPTFLSSSNVVYSEQQTITIHTSTPQNQNTLKLAQDQENEQFALAWLRATFEPASAIASRIEQQDLYKMYLTACSKIGRTGVVSHHHFPRCVQNVFGHTVGPNQIKIKQNTISSCFYEGIRIRAQPLAVVHKGTILQAAVTTTTIKGPDNAVKKDQPTIIKTSVMHNQKTNINQMQMNASSAPILQQVLSTNQSDHMHMTQNRTTIRQSTNSTLVSSAPSIVTSSSSGATSSSLIKAILANKVTTVDGTVIGTPNITTNLVQQQSINPSIISATSNVNVHQVAQRQHLQKQREAQLAAASAAAAATGNTTINVTNVSIGKEPKTTIVIKTPTGNVPPNMKATITGNTLIPATIIEKKAESMMEANKPYWDPVPPLAPLSGNSIRPTSIITSIPVPTVSPSKVDDDSNSTNQSANSSLYGTNPTTPSCQDESESPFAGFEGLLVPGNMKIDDDGKDVVVVGKHSQVVTANKMLADLLDRKSSDPPFNVSGDISNKRKIDANANPTGDEPPNKRINYIENDNSIDKKNQMMSKSSSSAANLYAKLAASLLEDEDMELDDTIGQPTPQQPPPQPQPTVIPTSTIVEQPKSVITVPMQRQIIVSPNNARPQMISTMMPTQSGQPMGQQMSQQMGQQMGQQMSQQMGQQMSQQMSQQMGQQMGQPTATIKTADGAYQTVPVILQHGNQQMGNIQIQKQIGGMGQQIIHQQVPQTQYMLATNQQGQTYLVAQQQPPPVNQILLTQTSQSQPGAPTKTIIILQQQTPTAVNTVSTPQKMIMTTQQGQQMIVTQVPRQHHVIVNQHTGNAGANVIQSNPQMSSTNAIINQVTNTPNSQPQIVSHMRVNSVSHAPVSMSSNVITTSEKKKVFVTGSGNIEVTQVSQPISHPNVSQNLTPNVTSNVIHKPIQQQSVNVPVHQSMPQATITNQSQPIVTQQTKPIPSPQPVQQQQQPPPPAPQIKVEPVPVKVEDEIDVNWLYVCDWRGCQRRKFRSANEVYLHACAEHCPDNIDPNADIYCQWGPGPNLCDNLPRKRFSLMTHINDRHITVDSFKTAVQRRIANGPQTTVTQPVTIIKKPMPPNSGDNATGTASPTLSTSSTSSLSAGSSAAMQAIKRHSIDLINPKELMFQDENEGPVTKSIRLTASLILRNLVNYTTTAKRCLRYYEPHLSSVALSNVESSRTIAQVLYEMNETRPY